MSRPSSDISSAPPGDRYDGDAVLALLAPEVAARIERLAVFGSLDSTNRYLLETPAPGHGAMHVALADHQHAGRGRRGREWIALPGAGLCLSVALKFASAPHDLLALPLAVGVAMRRAIAESAGIDTRLKWPNDLLWSDRKLGGILVEQASGSASGVHRVIGVGINVAMPAGMLPTLASWPAGAVDLAEATGGRPPSRIALAAAAIAQLAELAVLFEQAGFAAYRAEFASADALLDRAVVVVDDRATTAGVARGVDALGALLVETSDGACRRVFSGDVSIRPIGHGATVTR